MKMKKKPPLSLPLPPLSRLYGKLFGKIPHKAIVSNKAIIIIIIISLRKLYLNLYIEKKKVIHINVKIVEMNKKKLLIYNYLTLGKSLENCVALVQFV